MTGTFNANNTTYDGRAGSNFLLMTNGADFLTSTQVLPTIVNVGTVFAGDGNDAISIIGSAVPMTLDGGGGDDILMFSGANPNTSAINARAGNDLLAWSAVSSASSMIANGMDGNDTFWSGLSGNDRVTGEAGDDLLSFHVAGFGNDVFLGGSGFDSIEFTSAFSISDFTFGFGSAVPSTLAGVAFAFSDDVLADCSRCLYGQHIPSGSFFLTQVSELGSDALTETLRFEGGVVLDLRNESLRNALVAGDYAVTAVPEPATYALMLVGLLAVGAGARCSTKLIW